MKQLEGAKKAFVVLTESLLERIDSKAKSESMSRSRFVRLACEKALQESEREKQKPPNE